VQLDSLLTDVNVGCCNYFPSMMTLSFDNEFGTQNNRIKATTRGIKQLSFYAICSTCAR